MNKSYTLQYRCFWNASLKHVAIKFSARPNRQKDEACIRWGTPEYNEAMTKSYALYVASQKQNAG